MCLILLKGRTTARIGSLILWRTQLGLLLLGSSCPLGLAWRSSRFQRSLCTLHFQITQCRMVILVQEADFMQILLTLSETLNREIPDVWGSVVSFASKSSLLLGRLGWKTNHTQSFRYIYELLCSCPIFRCLEQRFWTRVEFRRFKIFSLSWMKSL